MPEKDPFSSWMKSQQGDSDGEGTSSSPSESDANSVESERDASESNLKPETQSETEKTFEQKIDGALSEIQDYIDSLKASAYEYTRADIQAQIRDKIPQIISEFKASAAPGVDVSAELEQQTKKIEAFIAKLESDQTKEVKPAKKKVDVQNWPEDQHPVTAREVGQRIAEISEALKQTATLDKGKVENMIKDLEAAVEVLKESLSLQNLETSFENASEVRQYLTKEYLDASGNPSVPRADDLLKTLRQQLDNFIQQEKKDREAIRQGEVQTQIQAIYDKFDGVAGAAANPLKILRDEVEKGVVPASVGYSDLRRLVARINTLNTAVQFVQSLDPTTFDGSHPEVKQEFSRKETAGKKRLGELQKLFSDALLEAIKNDTITLPDFKNLQQALRDAAAYTPAMGDPIPLGEQLKDAWEKVAKFEVTKDNFGPLAVPLSPENLNAYSQLKKQLEKQVQDRLNLLYDAQNQDLVQLIDQVLNPKKPLDTLKYSQFQSLLVKIRLERLRAVGRKTLSPELKKQADDAVRAIEDAKKVIESRDAVSMSWEDLVDEILSRNLDVYDHARYTTVQEGATRAKQLYDAFNRRKEGSETETPEQYQERIDSVVRIQLEGAQNKLQYEGQVAACARDGLIEELSEKRPVKREELLKAVQYHPVYGKWIREMLTYMIEKTADLNSPINYEIQISDRGRRTLETHIRRVFEQRIQQDLFSVDPLGNEFSEKLKREKYLGADNDRQQFLIDQIFAQTFNTYYVFSLIDVGFAELQSGTKTKGHDSKGKNDYTFISRPDAALVHRSLRYNIFTDWSLNTLIKLKNLPARFSRRKDEHATHEILLEIQKKLQLANDAYFDIDTFTGQNGIEPSKLFDPWFPNSYNIVSLGKGERLEFNGKIWGLDARGRYVELGDKSATLKESLGGGVNIIKNYGVAETGWKQLLDADLGNLPPVTTAENILVKGDKEGKKPGLIDSWTKAAGQAKMYQGEYLKRVFVPFLTHYIYRIFAHCLATGQDRENIYLEIVKKLKGETGLAMYSAEIDQVIENISAPGRAGEKSNINLHRVIRRKQRKAYLKFVYHEKHWHVPRFNFHIGLFGPRNPKDVAFWKKVNREPGPAGQLPETEVNRLGSFEKIKEEEK